MPEFILNTPCRKVHPFHALNEFARGYVEAMFFTNCDSGDDRENRANDMGVERLTYASIDSIAKDCARFELIAGAALARAYAREGYDAERAGRDFWFTRQGHGVGYWSRDELESEGLGDDLSASVKAGFGEVWPYFAQGWIHYN